MKTSIIEKVLPGNITPRIHITHLACTYTGMAENNAMNFSLVTFIFKICFKILINVSSLQKCTLYTSGM